MGIEPTFTAWEAVVLPLDDTRDGLDYGHRGTPTAMQTPHADQPMQIRLNGDVREVEAGLALATLIEQAGLAGRRVAIEVNGGIVPRSQHATVRLSEGDRVEIVHALGGG